MSLDLKFIQKNLNILILIIIIILLYFFSFMKEHYTNHGDKSGLSFEEDYMLVMYYADWCGYSRKAFPEFNGVGNIYETKNNKTVRIRAIECDEFPNDCKKQQIRGYPTILLFKRNTKNYRVEYNYARETQAIKDWLDKTAK